MFAGDLCIEGFEVEDWVNLGELLFGPGESVRSGVIAIARGEQLLKLMSTHRGSLDRRTQDWPVPLGSLARSHNARWALRLDPDAGVELAERIGAGLERNQDFARQLHLVGRVLRELQSQGLLDVWPRWLSSLPLPQPDTLSRIFNLFVEHGQSLVIAAFSGSELRVACALRRGAQGIDRLVGPRLLRQRMGPLSSDRKHDYRQLRQAVQDLLGPIGLGCFGELETLQRLLPVAAPGAWTRALATRQVILYPAAPGAVLPMTIDISRMTLATVGQLLQGVARLGVRSGWRQQPAAERHSGAGNALESESRDGD